LRDNIETPVLTRLSDETNIDIVGNTGELQAFEGMQKFARNTQHKVSCIARLDNTKTCGTNLKLVDVWLRNLNMAATSDAAGNPAVIIFLSHSVQHVW
jgi:hypothetical protein